jgi:hypothetical protein
MSIYTWEMATIPDYEPLDDCEGWLKCPRCDEYPRTWVFDNGNYARCRCAYKYEKGGAEALSIVEAVLKRRMPYDEYTQLLREAWNGHVRSMEV